ncbi:DUF6883 domain-containing protein [Hymenobacter caeli]|uniref:DUF6883 domain-containing protein n=1 Tax=Hymenobacter caeli TaxID=2735894 RepID=A0ABX2FNL5_9BACT|nr:DUF6883 domain-containing protein [Hymenobacter caeli]NRT18766.1 hypothetical protein [Hymenobacter caeli]
MTLHDKPLFVAPNKVQDYLLNPDHPIGGAKARFFLGIGYSREHYEQLIADLIEHGHTRPVTEEKDSPYGVKFVVDGPLLAPNGREYPLRTVWMEQSPGTFVLLITAHLLDR